MKLLANTALGVVTFEVQHSWLQNEVPAGIVTSFHLKMSVPRIRWCLPLHAHGSMQQVSW
jgi:hypothetical protein